MRRFIIAALMALAVVGLSAGAAAAQYVSPPGSSPSVGAAGFGGQSAEVMGESVTRDDAPAAGVAGIAGSPAAADTATADDSAEVAGEVATRGEAVGGSDDLRDLGSQTARSAGSGRSGSLLAFTGIALTVMALAGASLVGAGAVLRRFFGQTQEA